MTPIFIILFRSNSPAKAVAYTYNPEKAEELCSLEQTRRPGKWFLGWSKNSDYRDANVNTLPKAEDYLREIYANPDKKFTG